MNVFSQILQWDRDLFVLINRHWTNSWCDRFMPLISDPQPFIPFLVVGSVAFLIWGGFRGRLFIVLMALSLLIGDKGINYTIKHIIHRPRPYQAMEGVRMITRAKITISTSANFVSDGQSFTSGHACNNVALAFMACAVYGRYAAFLWLWAILISYSRIYTGNHYPLDIFGAWSISIFYSWMIANYLSHIWNRFGNKWFPKIHAKHPDLFRKPC